MATVLGFKKRTSRHFELALTRDGLEYQSGQWALLVQPDHVNSRPFSFSSSPEDREKISFLVKDYGEGFSSWLAQRQIGEEMTVGMPGGTFSPGKGEMEVWVAFGTGIAPFLSVIRSQKGRSPSFLLYVVHDTAEALAIPDTLSHRILSTNSLPQGARNDFLLSQLPLGLSYQYFLSGVPHAVKELKKILKTHVPPHQIHGEDYLA